MFQQLPDVAGIHQALDPQQLGGVDQRQKDLGRDGGLPLVHEGQEVLHHVGGQVRYEDDGVSHAARAGEPGPGHIATNKESSEIC